VLAGADGWLSSEIHAAIERLQLSALVTLTGSVTETEHAALFSAAQFFVFPSLFEGFGLPVLEAQQAGVPVMTANNSSLPEIAGDAAILVDPLDVEAIAQAMLDLSQDEALRQRLIAAGHENVKRFSWSKAAAETLKVLREAAKSKA
jgi:glycosyltransferase involved in cell wall biosynthesis